MSQKFCNILVVHTSLCHTRLAKTRTAINKLSVIWKSDLTDKMKCSFFQAAVVSILLYGCTTQTLTKRMEKKYDGNYTRMLRTILNIVLRTSIDKIRENGFELTKKRSRRYPAKNNYRHQLRR